jgi:serine O-acetyltransferase
VKGFSVFNPSDRSTEHDIPEGTETMATIDQFLEQLQQSQVSLQSLPSKADAHRFIDDLIAFLFPSRADSVGLSRSVTVRFSQLRLLLEEILLPLADRLPASADGLVEQFFAEVPGVYEELLRDARTIERFDPAAASVEEVIVAYPGFYAIAVHRLAHVLQTLRIPTLPRILSEYAHTQTGIDIHPGATIGSSFFIDHGTGIVIGETTVIGTNVKIYQGVTLGALSVQKGMANTKRHPTLEDNVIVYSGGTILGGSTVIGHDSVIGGNVWLTESVLPFSVVYHKSEVHVRNDKYSSDSVDFVI